MLPRSTILACALVGSACAGATAEAPPATIVEPAPVRTAASLSLDFGDPAPLPAPAAPNAEPDSPALGAAPSYREPVVSREQTRILVLMYHAFNRGSGDLSVDDFELENQLAWLADHHVQIVSLDDVVQFLDGRIQLPSRVAVITIDDGDKSVYRIAWPILQRHRAHFTLGLPTKLMQENTRHRMLTWDQVREMVHTGLCDVASHGHEHRSIVYLSDRAALDQLEESKRILREQTGRDPSVFIYPLGSFDDRTSALVKQAGYAAAFKAMGAPIADDCCDRYALPRVGIVHRDTVWTLGFYYSPNFLNRFLRLERAER